MNPLDKNTERSRYSKYAKLMIEGVCLDSACCQNSFGAQEVPIVFRTPYLYYENQLQKFISPGMKVLEIGSGTGTHTGYLLKLGAIVTATDISETSLE